MFPAKALWFDPFDRLRAKQAHHVGREEEGNVLSPVRGRLIMLKRPSDCFCLFVLRPLSEALFILPAKAVGGDYLEADLPEIAHNLCCYACVVAAFSVILFGC